MQIVKVVLYMFGDIVTQKNIRITIDIPKVYQYTKPSTAERKTKEEAMTNQQIREFYEGIVLMKGAPASIVTALILISKNMDDENKLTLYSELRQEFMKELDVGKSRMSQILKIMENNDIIKQSEEVKIIYHVNEFVLPYDKLQQSSELKFICTKTKNNTDIKIIE